MQKIIKKKEDILKGKLKYIKIDSLCENNQCPKGNNQTPLLNPIKGSSKQ